jgi:hypothetical protein
VLKDTQISLYNTKSLPVLCYGKERWTIRQGDNNGLRTLTRRTEGYTKCGHRGNEDILTELKIKAAIDDIKYYQKNWRSHVSRTNAGRF